MMDHEPDKGKIPVQEDPPPPYSAAQPATSSTETTSRPFAPSPESLVPECAIAPYAPIPRTLTAYYQLSYRTFHLGDHSNHKIFATSVYGGNSGAGPGRFSIILHNGPTAKDQPLAAAGEVHKSTSSIVNFRSLINLSPHPGQENVIMTESAAVAMEDMSARVLPDGQTVAFLFSVFTSRVSDAAPKEKSKHDIQTPRREQFEWRMTPKSEISDKDYAHEYKLFQLSDPNLSGWPSGSTSAGEPVAIAYFKRLMSLSKPFKMQFLDIETPDTPNERWRLMALVTALRVWQLEQVSFYSSTAMVETASKET